VIISYIVNELFAWLLGWLLLFDWLFALLLGWLLLFDWLFALLLGWLLLFDWLLVLFIIVVVVCLFTYAQLTPQRSPSPSVKIYNINLMVGCHHRLGPSLQVVVTRRLLSLYCILISRND